MGLIDSNLDDFKYEMEEDAHSGARIKVLGVGGGGCNAVARMVQEGVQGVEFYGLNTDLQALTACGIPNKLQLGAKITGGLGAGSNVELGREAALENTDRIVELLQGADMVFVTAGLGGGTGTGAAPVIASLARELDAVTVGVVFKPFGFEGARRKRLAEDGLRRLAATVDTMITIPNDRLLALAPRGTSFFDAFKLADDLLRQAVQGISDIILTPGLINRDFSDIKATMVGMGFALMGTATARGENAAMEAARQAITCPLLEDAHIAGSRSVLINITGSSKLGLHEVNEACEIIREAAECDDLQVNFGLIQNEAMGDAVKITVIATGLRGEEVDFDDVRPASFTKVTRVEAPPPEPESMIRQRMFEPEPEPEMEPEMEPEPESEPMLAAEPEQLLDMDDLDTPAYLRQGRLLN
jgi:cell division protein FtsZ